MEASELGQKQLGSHPNLWGTLIMQNLPGIVAPPLGFSLTSGTWNDDHFLIRFHSMQIKVRRQSLTDQLLVDQHHHAY